MVGAVVRNVAALLVALLALAAPSAASDFPPLASGPGERILAFDADITVAGTGDLHVIETIRVRVKGERIKRGIIRALSLAATTQDGALLTRRYQILSVTRDGHDEPYVIEVTAESMQLRIGSAESLLAQGDATYQITYRAPDQVRADGSMRELYWNVTGNGWVFGIDAATATIHLPDGARASTLKLFTGAPGSTAGDGRIVQREAGTIEAKARLPLTAGNGLTILIRWPAEPAPQRATRNETVGPLVLVGYVILLPLAVIIL
ncbi:MAG: DUF2207 domain-containing protein [Alphaproteobacteria bacterium]|nr:DUF2207 domain-containing protein [Alphaproteobacteria bacterium]